MNRKQKILKKTAKRAKAKRNKHTPPTIKQYVSKAEREKIQQTETKIERPMSADNDAISSEEGTKE